MVKFPTQASLSYVFQDISMLETCTTSIVKIGASFLSKFYLSETTHTHTKKKHDFKDSLFYPPPPQKKKKNGLLFPVFTTRMFLLYLRCNSLFCSFVFGWCTQHLRKKNWLWYLSTWWRLENMVQSSNTCIAYAKKQEMTFSFWKAHQPSR